MEISQIKARKAYEILGNYSGTNPYILGIQAEYKKGLEKEKIIELTKNQVSYIVKNENFTPKPINKMVEIDDYAAASIKKDYKLDFLPRKMYIMFYLGDTENAYHVIAKIQKGDQPKMYFVKKACVLDDFLFEPLPVDIDFTKYNERLMERRGYHLLPHQEEGVKFLLERNGAILADSMGLAKGEPLTNRLFTPYGRKKMGDIKVGDEVIGSNGSSTKVSGVFPLGKKPIYRVTFNDGYHLDVTDEHFWEVTTAAYGSNTKDKRGNKKYVLDVKQLIDKDGFVEEKHANGRTYKIKTYYKLDNGNNKWQIPIVKPIEFNINEELPIDPYLLGLSLGDGHFVQTVNSVKLEMACDDFDEIVKPFLTEQKIYSIQGKFSATIKLNKSLTDMGLNGTRSNNKFIPTQYKYTTIENRIAIMRGLMDADGCCVLSEKGSFKGAEYTSVSEQLVDDLAEIVHSLGGIVRKTKGQGKYVKNGVEVICKEYFKLNIKFNDINPFKLKRKSEKFKFPTKYKVGRYISNIEYIGEQEAQCIRVEAEDHLYVSEHAIVTHNTLTAIIAALHTRYKRVLVICPSSVKINWEREINTFIDNTTIVDGRVWKQARFTIINYDILQNFHTLDSKVDPNDTPMYLSRELVNAKFDLIIIDEAHNLRNKKSIRGEIVSELATKFGKPKVWLLTGTPVANRPLDFYNLLRLIRSDVADDYMHYMKRYCDGRQFNKKLANGKTKQVMIANGASNLDELAKRTKHLLLRRLKEEVVDMPEKQVIRYRQKLSEQGRRDYEQVWDMYLEKRKEEKKKGQVQREMVELGQLRKFIAMEGIENTYELAMEAVEQGEKVVVFTTFNEEQDKLAELFGNIAVRHNGGMHISDKQYSVDAFQNNDKIKVFIGNVISAGSGITLTAGTVTIFNSFSWVPGDNAQAEDRTWRIGQKNNCKVYYMLYEDTISEKVLDTLTNKTDVINQIIGTENEASILEARIINYILD